MVAQLLDQQQLDRALIALRCLESHLPDHPHVRYLRALHDSQTGRADSALALLNGLIESGSGTPEIHLQRARCLRQLGQLEAAREAIEDLIDVPPLSPMLSAVCHNTLGAILTDLKQLSRALAAYRIAADQAPDQRDYQANLLATELALGQIESAHTRAVDLCQRWPDFAPGFKCLGVALLAMNQAQAAIDALNTATGLDDQDADSWYQLGMALDEQGRWDQALKAHQQALRIHPEHGPALSEAIFLKRRMCDWQGLETLEADFVRAVDSGRDGLKPFTLLSFSNDAALQLRCAKLWASQCAARVEPLPSTAVAEQGPWRIGYLSSGFHQHPTALLTAEYFEQHDREHFSLHAYSVGPNDQGPLRQRLESAFDCFTDCAQLSYSQLARTIRDDRIDLLIDLRGYGGGAVTEVFAMRPAPIQVNWLAYPGTMGAPFIDAIIADPVVIPEAQARHYSEAIWRLPNRFQPNDTTRAIPDQSMTRQQAGLPETGLVLCSFNNSYKLSGQRFATWMAILRDLPGSVLWLLDGKTTDTATHLKRAAAEHRIDPERLILMPKRSHQDYLACLSLADLFLDTSPYNAHTTASDALWAACPVLTLPGETFASRVAASLVSAVGLGESLIAESEADYLSRAIALGRDGEARARLRSHLETARSGSPLFDTVLFSRQMAELMRQLIEDKRSSSARH